MGDLLGADDALVEKNALYCCLDKLLPHKEALFSHLRQRWQDLFGAKFDVLLYDLTAPISSRRRRRTNRTSAASATAVTSAKIACRS